MTSKRKRTWRRGRPRDTKLDRPDLPYCMKLPDGRTVYVEVPGRMTVEAERGEIGFTPEGVRFLDRVRALAMPQPAAPSPAYITNLREALGMTQPEFGETVGVDKMTVSRWERGTMQPGKQAVKQIHDVAARAKRRGVALAG